MSSCALCLSLLQSLGSLAIGVSFGYMSFSMFVIALLLMPIAAATFRVNEGEGHFRWLHARIKEFSECSTFPCDPADRCLGIRWALY